MVKYDTSRTVRFCMDSGTRYDKTVHNTIISRLRNIGFTVTDGGIGPGTLGNNYMHIPSKGHHIIFNLANGVDTTNIREAISTGDGTWTKSYMEGKDVIVVLAWFGSSVDCVHQGGTGYEHLCTHSSGVGGCGGPMYNAKQKMDTGGAAGNKVYAICCSSDGGSNPSQSDTTGNKIVDEFLKFFEINDGTNDTNQNTITDNPITDDTGKTISTITTEKIYTKPYYQTVTTTTTNNLGVFTKAMNLPIAGKYRVNLTFSGDKDYSPSQKTINIQYYAGSIFKEELLETITTKKYTDGTTNTTKQGNVGKNTHTRSVITTQTYKSGKIDKTTTTEIENDKVNTDFKNNTTDNTPTTNDNNTSENTSTTIPADAQNPFETVVEPIKNPETSDYQPNVEKMHYNNTPFKWVDYTKTYILSKERFMEVLDRDSKIMQLQEFNNSKYTAFTSDDEPNTYHVIKRERWNAVEEALYYRQVQNDTLSSPVKMPDAIKIDFANQKLTAKIDSTWRSVSIDFKASECNYWFCADRQNNGNTCGPTSSAVATQVVHKYLSEGYIQSKVHAGINGSGPYENIQTLNKNGFTATQYTATSNWDDYISRLRKGQPIVIHQSGHYMCSADVSDDEQQILVLNSAGETTDSSYNDLKTGWNDKSTVKSHASLPGWWIEPNWTINESEKNQINNFYNSMGGAWKRKENRNEKIRKAYTSN
ncbi:hypothetical protein [Methanosphaera sp.]|uniref:hypothetical protein n=1 Tax=Methanosphaera sp. TaxID=2666342 RepID=UPI003D8BB194